MRSSTLASSAVLITTSTAIGGGTLINLDSVNDCTTNADPKVGTVMTLPAGEYLLTPTAAGYTAYNPWGGGVFGCDGGGANCTQGWQVRYYVHAGEIDIGTGDCCWQTPELALANAPSLAFTLCDESLVTFQIRDSPCGDNVGGDSLLLTSEPFADINGNGIPDSCECLADLDSSGSVDINDLLAMLSDWGPCTACPADLNLDGAVTITDLLALLSAWGPCP